MAGFSPEASPVTFACTSSLSCFARICFSPLSRAAQVLVTSVSALTVERQLTLCE